MRLGVRVLSSNTFRAILKKYGERADRICNENLFARWKLVQLPGPENLKTCIEDALAELAAGISFSALNGWIDDATLLFKEALDRERKPGDITRAAYFCSALVALGADYLGRELSFADTELRFDRFRQGLLFGRVDPDASRSYIDFAEKIVTDYLDPTGAAAAAIRTGFEQAVEKLPITGLVEFFAKPAAGKELIDGAIALEAAAYARDVSRSAELRPEARSIIGLLLDYAGLPRTAFLGATAVAAPSLRSGTAVSTEQSPLPFASPSEKEGGS